MMKRTALLASLFSILAFAAPASAHEGAIGDGGPFRVEVTDGLPAEIDARYGNGEVEFHVPAGTELVAIGVDNEPFAKIDAEGNMFGNVKSPTWWLVQDGSAVPETADATAEPEWQWVKGGGSLQYHDHRIHFMQSSVRADIQNGDTVFEFSLPFQLNGADVSVRGALVWDETLDPEMATMLKSGTAPDGNNGSNATTVVFVVIGLLGAIAAAAVVIARRR